MITATDTLWSALDRPDRGVADKSVGKHEAPNSTTRSRCEDHGRQLMARVAAKDQQPFTLLYQRYAPRLGRFLSKSLKSHTLVDEAVNDTMFVLWRKASEFDPDRARLSTWLLGIAHHAGLKAHARSAKASCRSLGSTPCSCRSGRCCCTTSPGVRARSGSGAAHRREPVSA